MKNSRLKINDLVITDSETVIGMNTRIPSGIKGKVVGMEGVLPTDKSEPNLYIIEVDGHKWSLPNFNARNFKLEIQHILTELEAELDQMVHVTPNAAIELSANYIGALLNTMKRIGMPDEMKGQAFSHFCDHVHLIASSIYVPDEKINQTVITMLVDYYRGVYTQILEVLPKLIADDFGMGIRVTYVRDGKREKGVIKEFSESRPENVRVVYHCNNEWEDYMEYTGVLTEVEYLRLGWDE